jgi:hypothetical protein
MKLVKAHEPIILKNLAILIYGEPGIGKSTLGNTANNPLVLDYDGGAQRTKNRNLVIQPEGDTEAVLAWIEANERDFGDVIIDTAGGLVTAFSIEIVKANPKNASAGGLSPQGWGILGRRMEMFKARILALGKDLVILAHNKEDKSGDNKIVRAAIQGGARDEINRSAEMIAYMSALGTNRTLNFSPTEASVGKNPCEWDILTVPHYATSKTFLADLLAQAKQELGKIDPAAEALNNAIEVWRKKAEAATDMTPLFLEFAAAKPEGTLKSAAWALLIARGKVLGTPWDARAKKFQVKVAPPKPTEVPAAAPAVVENQDAEPANDHHEAA